jgi:immune inhibitor A
MIKEKEIVLPYHLANRGEALQRGINSFSKISSKRNDKLLDGSHSSTFKAIAIFVKFTDNISLTPIVYFDSLLYGVNGNTLRSYFSEVSRGTLDVVTVNFPSSMDWMDAPQLYSYYVNGQNGFGSYPQNAQKLAEDAIAAANNAVDFSQYDNDNDGYVDALFIIHAGQGAEYTGNANDIWSHQWGTSTPQLVDGVRAYIYSMEPEYWSNPGDMTCGVYAHEAGHAIFGLPDLYDYNYDSDGIGAWSLMAGGSWNGSLGSSPAHPDAWSLYQMGFASQINIISDTAQISISSVEDSGIIYRLWTEGSANNEYYLVENRRRTGYDVFLPGDGLCIYHIDDYRSDNNNQWYPGYTTSGHYKVALEQADGLWDLEKYQNGADGGDPYPGSTSNTRFDNHSVPNSNDYLDKRTYVSVSNISNSAPTMTADFAVKIIPPDIDVAPSSFIITAGAGDSVSQTMTIRNKGLGDLDYQIPLAPSVAMNEYFATNKFQAGSSSVAIQSEFSDEKNPKLNASGGPDAFGYSWMDSDQSGGPVFDWIDISGDGTPVALTYLRGSGFIPLGFDFKYYGNTFNQVSINSSGFISFTMDGAWIPFFSSLPSEWNPSNMVAIMAADLVPIGTCYYLSDTANHRFIVEYQDWGKSGGSSPDYTMEIILHEDGRIVFQYLKMNGQPGGVVGIQNAERNIGLKVGTYYSYLKSNLAVEFRLLPKWLSAEPSAGTILSGESQNVTLKFSTDSLTAGSYNGAVYISSNDLDESIVSIPFTFTVFDQASISGLPDTIDFGDLIVDSIHADTIIIKNKGSLTLDCNSISTDNPAFSVNQTSLTVLPKSNLPIVVSFTPDRAGNLSSHLTIHSNDPQDSIITIQLTGRGVYPPAIAIDADTLKYSLHRGDSLTTALRISNTGLGDLLYDISVGQDNIDIGDTITALSGKLAIRGNVWSVKERSMLSEIKFFLSINNSTELYFVVYESSAKTGPFNRINVKLQMNSGVGRRFYPSGPMNTTLLPGKYYFIALTSRDSVTFYRQPRTLPIDTLWGKIYSSGLYYYIPPPLSISPTLANTSVIYQTLSFSKDYVSIVSPPNGVVSPGSSTDVIMKLCANRRLGINHLVLKIDSNDPVLPQASVPVELMIRFQGIHLDAGWNMLSVPLKVSDYHKNSIFDACQSDAFYYNEGYQTADTLQEGLGYWMKFPAEQTIYIDGEDIPFDTLALKSRWNMVGTLTYPVPASSLTKISPVTVLSGVIGYSNDIGYFNADTIVPGYGYWLKSDTTGKIILSSTLASPSVEKAAYENDRKFAGGLINSKAAGDEGISNIIFTDAKGRKRILYFTSRQKQIDFTSYEFPPPPPSGVFDVRFSSQRNIEVWNDQNQTFPILLNGAVSPLTLNWDIKEQTVYSSLQIDDKIIEMGKIGTIQISNPESEIKLRLSLSSPVETPEEFALQQNYPNPFNPTTVINYLLPIDSYVKLKVYNLLGQEVATLVDGEQLAGYHEAVWDASAVPSGVYYYKLHAGNFTEVKKMLLVR